MKKYYFAFFLIAFFVIMASPLMAVKDVVVQGNEKFSVDEIINMAGYSKGVNVFAFSTARASDNLLNNTYIKSVDIKKDYLSRKLTVTVNERRLSGYIKFNENTFLFIDKEGMVLESRSSFADRRPVIEGLEFSEFTMGDYLNVKNTKAFETMVTLSHLFEKFEIEHDIVRVDLKQEDEIHFYYGNIDVQIGSASDLDIKVRTFKAILPELEEYKSTGGFLYMQESPPRFSILS